MRNLFLTFAVASISGALSAAPPNTPNASVHRVRKGDTGASIARANGLSLAQLAVLNPKVQLAKLKLGMSIHITHPPQAVAANNVMVASSVPALPATPTLRNTGLSHLERMLPSNPNPEASNSGTVGSDLNAPDRFDTGLQPVLGIPTASEAGSLKAPEFVPVDREHMDLIWPVETRSISSAWGPRMRSKVIRVKNHHKKKRVRYRGSHKGVDLNAPQGTSVFAAMDGQVVAVGRQRQYGNFVTIDHGNGVITHYGHHRANLVEVGDVVRRGQKIAEVGRTGNATGPHLHFELRMDGSQRNPLPFMNDEEEISSEVLAMNAHLLESRR
jgi:murein DD-endopeptidase MepM/ murein hydrolase activator NlpD